MHSIYFILIAPPPFPRNNLVNFTMLYHTRPTENLSMIEIVQRPSIFAVKHVTKGLVTEVILPPLTQLAEKYQKQLLLVVM